MQTHQTPDKKTPDTPSSSQPKRHIWRWVAAGMAAAGTMAAIGLAGTAQADDHEGREHHGRHERHSERGERGGYFEDRRQTARLPMLKAYQTECASCHMGFDPRFLPAASWQRIMGNLRNHYGTDASLDAATVASINQWLLPQAGGYKRVSETPPPQDRITQSAWFVRKHREVPAATFKRVSIKSPANCMACHTGADKGDYDEHAVRIPK